MRRQKNTKKLTILHSNDMHGDFLAEKIDEKLVGGVSLLSGYVNKVRHEENEAEEELNMIIDLGGIVKDVFVYHKVYGVLRADMNIKSRMDIRRYMEKIATGKSSLLKNVTSGFHYHTILADSEEILDIIQEELGKQGFLAKLQDYEPVDFWKKEEA